MLNVQDRAARSAMSERQAVPLSPQEDQGGASAGQGQQAAQASVSPVRKSARRALAAAGVAVAEDDAAVHAAAATCGPQRQQPTQAESLSATAGNHLQGVQQLAAGDGLSQSWSPVAPLHSHFQSRLQAAGLDSVDLLQLARHREAIMSVGEPRSASGQGHAPRLAPASFCQQTSGILPVA